MNVVNVQMKGLITMDANDVYFLTTQIAASWGVPTAQAVKNFREKRCGMPFVALLLISLNLVGLVLRGVKNNDILLQTVPAVSLILTSIVIFQAWLYRKAT